MAAKHTWVGLCWLAGCAPALETKTSNIPPASDTTDATTDTPPDDTAAEEDTGDSEDPPAEPCGLTAAVDTPYWTEGDVVTLTFGCTTSDGADTTFAVAGAGDGWMLDLAALQATWQTSGRDGGRWDVTVAATPRGRTPETQVLTVWVADSPDAPDAQAPDPTQYTEEWGLPVVHLTVGAPLTEADQAAVITLDGETVEGSAHVRGASSASYPKTSLTLDFGEDKLTTEAWGHGPRKHLILTSTFDDNSYIRQKLSYLLWEAMAEDATVPRMVPKTFFTVLYLNGEYQGLYLGSDRIDDEFVEDAGFSGEGPLYKAISHDANFWLTDASGWPKSWLGIGYEKKEGNPDDWTDLDALVSFTGSVSPEVFEADGPDVLEIDAFIDWYIWAVVLLAEDTAGKNSYLYQDLDTGIWHPSPWDINHSLGQNWYTARTSSTSMNTYRWNNRVFVLLQDNPAMLDRLRARYWQLRTAGALAPDALEGQVDELFDALGPNITRDWTKWESAYRTFGRWAGERNWYNDWTTPEQERAYMRSWITERLDHIDSLGGPY